MFSLNLTKTTRSRSSFTLIELLIIIGIIMIFTTLSLSIIVSLRNQRQVKTVAEQVKSRIMEAHSFAVSPPEDATSGVTDAGVQLSILNGSPAQLAIIELPIPTNTSKTNYYVNYYDLPSNISFDSNPPTVPPSPPPSTITINFSATGNNIGQISSSVPVVLDGQTSFTIQSTNDKHNTITVNQFTGSVEIN